MNRVPREQAFSEALAIPASVRAVLDERDARFCRMCGRFCGAAREHHHIVFGGSARGMGGRRVHDPDEMVSLCQACHGRAHGEKGTWAPLLLRVAQLPGVTAAALRRQDQRRRANEDMQRRLQGRSSG